MANCEKCDRELHEPPRFTAIVRGTRGSIDENINTVWWLRPKLGVHRFCGYRCAEEWIQGESDPRGFYALTLEQRLALCDGDDHD